jgi:ABC-2 type transport system permease protein
VNGLLAKAWRDHRRTLIGFGIGLVATELIYLAVYPAMRDSAADLQKMMEKLPAALRAMYGEDIASPAGYLRAEMFGELGLILFLIVAIGGGARAIAGEEEARTLDLLLVTPVKRAEVLRSKAIALAGLLVLFGGIVWGSVLVLGPLFGLHVGVAGLATATLMLVLLSIAFASIALAIGAATGHRATAIAVTTGAAVLMYIVNGLGVTVEVLRPLRPLSLMRWYSSPLLITSGLQPKNIAVFVGVTVVAYAIAHVMFGRRDLAS